MRRLRYEHTASPIATDGRDIHADLGLLVGEAGGQRTGPEEAHTRSVSQAWAELPEPLPQDPTYYDRPLLKAPVWKLYYIPTYYYVGGLAGASLALGAAAQLDRSAELNRMIRRCHWIGIIGSTIGAALLIADLGRPMRFLFMLRVFRPTSAMNLGAWVLAVAPTAAVTAGIFTRSEHSGLRLLGESAGYTAGIFGLALATYTGVLVAESAIPFWHEGRRALPLLFGASAAASAGSLFDLLFTLPRACRITRTFGIVGRVTELAAARLLEHDVKAIPQVGKPLESGLSAILWRGAEVLTAASLFFALLPRQSRRKRVAAGVFGTAGSLLMRYAVHECGVASARDPRASFYAQRVQSDAKELRSA
jgi:formate-dependent nitrite reductase membrane component NrfD